MKVVHVFNEINFSGAELMYASAAKLFQKGGVEMLAISTGESLGNFSQEFENQNIRVFHMPFPKGTGRIGYHFNFYKFLLSEKIDLVHMHRSDLVSISFFTRLAGINSIMTVHNNFKHRFLTYPYGVLKRFVARNICNVTYQTIGESVFENELNYYYNKTIRINNWYDFAKFYPTKGSNEKSELRKKFEIDDDRFVIISVGGCSEIKNHKAILNALTLLKPEIDFLYIHLGTGSHEECEIEFAEKLKLKEKVWFLGNKSNVRDYLIVSDVFVMPSKFEGLSIASIEAMGCGLPSILYNSPGLKDLIDGNNNGFLINPDYKLMANKLNQLYYDIGLRHKMGESALNFVEQNFSMRKNVSEIILLYELKV